MYEYWLLFSSGFVSATLFPGGSEVIFIYYLNHDPLLKWPFFLSILLGNSLGSITTYFLGYFVKFGQKDVVNKYPKTLLFCKQWGNVALLLSWLPIIGDIICLFCGWLKLNKKIAFMNILIGKSIRYLMLMAFFIF